MEQVTQEYKDSLKARLPLDESIAIPYYSGSYLDINTTPMSEIISEKMKIQESTIQELMFRVEDLTKIINVIAPSLLEAKGPKRTLPYGEN